MKIDPNNLRAADSETQLFRPGLMAPPAVCGSVAHINGDQIEGELLTPEEWTARLRQYLLEGRHIAFANAAYDLCVLAQRDPSLFSLIFKALDEGRIIDILIIEALHAIYNGHLGRNPNGSELRDSKGEVKKRYSLDIVTQLVLGRFSKVNDVFRESYDLFATFPMSTWPPEAQVYPIDDARDTLQDAVAQIFGVRGKHEWVEVPPVPGVSRGLTICKHCNGELTLSWPAADDRCPAAPLVVRQNIDDMAAQVDADFCFKLGSAHSFRTDPERVEALAKEVEAKHAKFVQRFQAKGWIRDDGTEDQAAVKKAIALAYGATGTCPRCAGGCPCRKCGATGVFKGEPCSDCDGRRVVAGKVQQWKTEPCRGHKVSGRYKQGCTRTPDCRCAGAGTITIPGSVVICKNVYDADDNTIEFGCDGTGLDLSTAKLLPRTKSKDHPRRLGGVATDRDSCMESGDDDISDYGENEFEKSRSTYLPYLRTGLTGPLKYSPNVIVATGRGSIEDSPLHQMPRAGKERKCIRARGAWCGVPIEYILGSTDYEAGELCTLSQFTYWLFGYSQMREAINRSGKPGILHSDLASEVIGISLDEFLKRLKAKDQQAVDFRQMCKPINFGVPGRMGVPKLVLTSRKKNAGFTPCAFGPAHNDKGVPGYWGVRFCVLAGAAKRCGEHKLLKWKGHDCPPVCKMCCKVVDELLLPAYDRKYPEVRKDYFRWCDNMMDNHLPAPTAIWDPEADKPRIVRERLCESPSEFSNNGFQSLLATIGKHAFCRATRECYLGVKPDGSPSPLYGSRLPIYLHDEPLSELRLDSFQQAGPRIAEIMVASGQLLAPDVVWKAETAAAFWWDKAMEPQYQKETGLLMPWGPIPVEHQQRFQAAA